MRIAYINARMTVDPASSEIHLKRRGKVILHCNAMYKYRLWQARVYHCHELAITGIVKCMMFSIDKNCKKVGNFHII